MGHTRKLWSGRNIPRPQASNIQLSKTKLGRSHTHFDPPASNGKQVRHSLKAVNKKQKGQPFSVAALLETGILFQDGQVTARASVLTHSHVPEGSLLNWNKCFTHLKRIRTLVEIQAFS